MAPRKAHPGNNPGARPPLPHSIDTPWRDAPNENQDSDSPWLMSYLDFMTVLVTLFVFLYAAEKMQHTAKPDQPSAIAPAPVQIPAEPAPAAAIAAETNPPAPSPTASGTTAVDTPPPTATAEAAMTSTPEIAPQADAVLAASTNNDLSVDAATPVITSAAATVEQPASATTVDTPAIEATSTPAQATPLPALDKLADRIMVKQDAHKLLIEINEAILFQAGHAELSDAGKALLNELRPVLLEHTGSITVEGHTDDRPIATAQYPSNWELSTARASIVTRHLIGLGIQANRIRPIGHADTQPRASNATAEGRAQNRRVGIVLHTD